MMRPRCLFAWCSLALGSAALAQPRAYTPGAAQHRTAGRLAARFIRYTTVDRPDRKIIRNMYMNPEAYAALQAGRAAALRHAR